MKSGAKYSRALAYKSFISGEIDLFLAQILSMKKIRRAGFIALASTLVFSSSCNKKGELKPPTQTELITAGTWKFQAATYAGTDISTSPQIACLVDNTLTFTGANYTVTEGTVICTPTTAATGTWSFKPTDSLLLSTALVPGTNSGAFHINSLTSANLVLQQNATLVPPTPQPLVVTFKH